MGTYTKLQSSILHSTVWMEPNHIRILWITMLAMKDKNGIVEASIPGLASVARITNEECEDGLNRLSAPDRYSRTRAHNGRRIESMEGGWIILNHEKYRGDTSTDRVRRHRAKKQYETQCNVSSFQKRCETDGTRETASVSESVSESVSNQENKSKNPQTPKGGSPPAKSKNGHSVEFEKFRMDYPGHRHGGKLQDWKSWQIAKKAGLTFQIAEYSLAQWKASQSWNEDGGKYIVAFSKFCRDGYWQTKPRDKPASTAPVTKAGKAHQKNMDFLTREIERINAEKNRPGNDSESAEICSVGLPGTDGGQRRND